MATNYNIYDYGRSYEEEDYEYYYDDDYDGDKVASERNFPTFTQVCHSVGASRYDVRKIFGFFDPLPLVRIWN